MKIQLFDEFFNFDLGTNPHNIGSGFSSFTDGNADATEGFGVDLSADDVGANAKWFRNDGDGNFALPVVVDSVVQSMAGSGVAAGDLDGDGDQDLIVANERKLSWFENTDGNGTFGERQVIASISGTNQLIGVDLDDDGRTDVLQSSTNNGVQWYRNLDNMGSFEAAVEVAGSFGARLATISDLDRDRDLDIVAIDGTSDSVVSYEQLNPAGTFAPVREITSSRQLPLLAAMARAASAKVAASIDLLFENDQRKKKHDELFYIDEDCLGKICSEIDELRKPKRIETSAWLL